MRSHFWVVPFEQWLQGTRLNQARGYIRLCFAVTVNALLTERSERARLHEGHPPAAFFVSPEN